MPRPCGRTEYGVCNDVKNQWLDLRGLEGGWGERRLEREAGFRPHRKAALPWMEMRGQVGVGMSARCQDTFTLRKSWGRDADGEGRGGQDASSVGAAAWKRDGTCSP